VLTAAGAVAIGSLGVGDHVLAYDETTGTTASYPISVVHINADPETGTVVIGGEVIETTPEHPFYTLEAGWLDAADLEPGMHVPSASGEPGEISSVDFAARPAIMYNLTVEVAHTFFVGEGEWLVHNTGCRLRDPGTGRFVSDPSRPAVARSTGRQGGQARLRELADDPRQPRHVRGWIQNEMRHVATGNRRIIRRPIGHDLAHVRGKDARLGFPYAFSQLQLRANHRIQNAIVMRRQFAGGPQ
jgi:plasmid stabilization system protein ParE